MTTVFTDNAALAATTREQHIRQRENEIVNAAAEQVAKLRAAYSSWLYDHATGAEPSAPKGFPEYIALIIARAWLALEQYGPLEPVEVPIPRSFL